MAKKRQSKKKIDEMLDRASPNSAIKRKILVETKKYPEITLVELARLVPCPLPEIEGALAELNEEGYEVQIGEGVVRRDLLPPPAEKVSHFWRIKKSEWLRVGIVSDTHLGNQHAREDVLNTAYDHFMAEGITKVYHGGNLIDGYKVGINEFELVPDAGPSIERQINYAAEKYPKRQDIETYFITGCCHEGWWVKKSGLNIGRLMQARFRECGREDLFYTGHLEVDYELRTPSLAKDARGPIMRVLHPGGGTAYALSYKAQKISESLQGGEKPQIQIITHFHKFDYNYHREIHNIMPGCMEDQTTFMRKHHIPAHVGYVILEMRIGQDGILEALRLEWKPFYDRGFYQKWDRQ